jgi:hypothetical protein
MNRIIGFSTLVLCAVAAGTHAAEPRTDEVIDRNVNQQERIEQGLQSGQLNTREAGELERQETRIDLTEARDLKDGKLSPREQARINRMQNRTSANIAVQKHDGQTGNPDSRSSERMQADVARNVRQEQRIDQGIENGTLTHREVGSLERGQARVDRREATAARDGHVGPREQTGVQGAENHQSRRIHRRKAS